MLATRDKITSVTNYSDSMAPKIQPKADINAKEIRTFESVSRLLETAAKMQTCPFCKHDIEVLNEFVEGKLAAAKNGRKSADKELRDKLKSVDYVNEMLDIGMGLTRAVGPIASMLRIAPDSYRNDVLKEMIEINRKIGTVLSSAKRLVDGIGNDRDCAFVSDVLESFIRAAEFKAGLDPKTFYVFDKIVYLGYKTKLLNVAGMAITSMKNR